MRLLETGDGGKFSLTEDLIGDDKVPAYAILSHTWQAGQEVTFDDLVNNSGNSKAGYRKLQFCAQQAERDGLRYFWVDTCCINKADNIELQNAINSMFRWYRDAAKCYVYLSDVSIVKREASSGSYEFPWEPAFRDSRWFTRGWTLQELLAPRSVEFFSQEGKPIGSKSSLEGLIHNMTSIAIPALRGASLHQFSVEERLSWTKSRQTTRKEDKAYCLLGIFGIFMSLIYGEGEENAFKRLRKKIDKSSKDILQQQTLVQLGRVQPEIPKNMKETPKAPWLVPFPRPLSFVGRGPQLAQLGAHISSEGCQRIAIYGLGGCGKTALALEAAFRASEDQPARAIFWIPAVSRESFEQAYQEIGILLRIPGIADDTANIKQLVKAKLSDEGFGQWLIVLDNVDDVGDHFDPLKQESDVGWLTNFLPHSRTGSIIFTTRTRKVAVKLAGNNVISLGALSEVEAKEVLKTRLLQEHQHQVENETAIVHEFLNMLSLLALAIIQAVAFINTNDITLFDYISRYRSSEKEAMYLLSKEFEDQGRHPEAKNPVATTWYISFEQIQSQNTLAGTYLFFMACTATNDIPASMLPPGSSTIERIEAIGTLKAYAFITERQVQRDRGMEQTERPAKTFDVHPLVHLAIQGWLKAHSRWHIWAEKTLVRLVEIIPYGDYDKREVWAPYLPHAIHVVCLPEVCNAEARMLLLDRIGRCEQTLGWYKTAEWAHRQLLARRKKLLGKEHPDTLASMNEVGVALGRQGKHAKAEKMHRKTRVLSEKVLGKEHPDTLTSMNNVALELGYQGEYADAEKMHRETLALREKVLGREHPHNLTSMSNVALALSRQEKHAEAEDMHRETLALREKMLGKQHPDTLTSMHNLAQAMQSQGQDVEAEKMHQETLVLRKKVLGKEHPDTLASMSSLARVLGHQGKHAEAEYMHRETLALRERILGKEHPDTLMSTQNLAQAVHSQGKLTEAAAMYKETLLLRRRVLGTEHPDTLASMSSLARVLGHQGKHAEAEDMHRETLALRKKVLGRCHSQTLMSMHGLAQAVSGQGKHAEAEEIHRRELDLKKEALGEEHPNTLASMNEVGMTLRRQGNHTEAEKMHRQTLALSRKVFGKKHPETITIMNNVGVALNDQGRLEEAENMFRDTLALREKVLGIKHRHTLSSVHNLAQVVSSLGKHAEAEGMYRRELELGKNVLGEDHLDVLASIASLAKALHRQGKHAEAVEVHRSELEHSKKVLGEQHPDTLASLSRLARALGRQRKYAEAIPLMQHCIQMREEILGPQHHRTQASLKALCKWQKEA